MYPKEVGRLEEPCLRSKHTEKRHNANLPYFYKQNSTLPMLMTSHPMPISVQGGSIIISVLWVIAQAVPEALLRQQIIALQLMGHGGAAVVAFLFRSQTECIWLLL